MKVWNSPPSTYGIGATIRIGQERLCLPYAGFFRNRFLMIYYATIFEVKKWLEHFSLLNDSESISTQYFIYYEKLL